MRLKDRIAFITASGHGIGRSIAEKMAAEGATVVVTDRDQGKMDETVNSILSNGGKAEAKVLDVTDKNAINESISGALKKYGKIDILVNNAGGGWNGPIWEYDEEKWDSAINLSLKSVFRCTRAVVDSMMKNKYGRIINTASVVGVSGKKNRTAYGAAKGGVIAMTKVWAMELAPYGITVNCISPGAIASYENINWEKGCWLGRSGKPDDIGGAAVFLASADADFITGQNLIIDGGRTIGMKGDA